MQICNACRYCEGFCAVFQAMTRRLEFGRADVHYLANLCHNCGACLHACQYAPPHEFAVNVPKAMSIVRTLTYAEFAWPQSFAGLYARNGIAVSAALALGAGLFLLATLAVQGTLSRSPPNANFYAIFPHGVLATVFGFAFLFAMVALAVGAARFWRSEAPGPLTGAAAADATGSILRLEYLDGGHGEGCNEADDRFTLARRRFHHLTFYGFLLCFAATSVATLYHYAFGWEAPYALTSLPVVLGTLGGVGLVIGPAGLLWLNLRRDPRQVDDAQKAMDRGFIVLLLLTGVTGLAVLAWRETAAMASLLALHLGCVLALFVTLPYGKFAHAVYRSAALLKWAIEKRLPNRLELGSE